MIIEELRGDETLRQELGTQGRATFYDRANPAETPLENSLEQMNLQDERPPHDTVIAGTLMWTTVRIPITRFSVALMLGLELNPSYEYIYHRMLVHIGPVSPTKFAQPWYGTQHDKPCNTSIIKQVVIRL